jgi:hypothetical protein
VVWRGDDMEVDGEIVFWLEWNAFICSVFSLERILLYKTASVVLWLFAGTVLGCAWTPACQDHIDGRVRLKIQITRCLVSVCEA